MTQVEEVPARALVAPSIGGRARLRVGIIGASGYVGGELIRLLERHPGVRVSGLQARDRQSESIGTSHPHLGGTGQLLNDALPRDVDAVFVALPHGAAASLMPDLLDGSGAVIDLGADFRLRDPADYPRWYRFEHPAPDLIKRAVYGLPELHRAELTGLAMSTDGGGAAVLVASPGCYPTATLLALAPLARDGLIADLVVDAKSGVSGAGREAKPEYGFAELNESIKAYGVGGHRHVAEMEQELALLGDAADANPGARGIDFLPHLVPMTRGILAACHVRPARPVSQRDLDALYHEVYADEPFVRVVPSPPSTKHVLGSNECLVHVSFDERTGRVLAIAVIDNLVKGAAGQAIQAFNLCFDLPETQGLEQLPLAP